MIVELLLSGHPDDCLYCARNGGCDLQRLSQEMGIRQRIGVPRKSDKEMDVSGASIIRNPDKCILCGKCVRVCEEIQGVAAIDFIARGSRAYIGTAFDEGLNVSSCVNCGQCILVCPTGALSERSYVEDVVAALADPQKYVVVQHAPSVSVTLAEEFGLKPGTDVDGQMVAGLRRMGFRKVFDTSFAAPLPSVPIQRLPAVSSARAETPDAGNPFNAVYGEKAGDPAGRSARVALNPILVPTNNVPSVSW